LAYDGGVGMKTIGLAAGLVLIVGLSACGGSDEDSASAPVMPVVTGEKLDVAFGAIKDAGFDDDVDVDGGGTLGIIDESNWQVCEQTPAAGEPMTDAPKLTVDRSCGGDGDEDESPTTTAETPETTTTAAPANLTAANNPELAALLAGTECGDTIAQFASKYRGRTIEFDGNIVAMQPHENYDTRYDILMLAGDFNGATNPGPNFVFRDVNTTNDLHYTGDVPDTIGQGTNLHVVAEVGDYEASRCLLLLEPVSTQVR
jgi:hypothetical protein